MDHRVLLRHALLLTVFAGLITACAPVTTAPEFIGALRTFGPNVTINGAPAVDGAPLRGSDVIATGPGSRARISFTPGGFVQLEENTDPNFLLRWLSSGLCLVKFVIGNGSVSGDTDPCDHKITDPLGNEIIAGSRYVLTVAGETSVLTMLGGRARVSGARVVEVNRHEQVVMTRNFISRPHRLSDREIDLLSRWIGDFDLSAARPAVELVFVPRVVGLSVGRAERRLANVDLALGRVEERPSAQASPGTLLEQRPAAGSRVPPGTAIYVDIAVALPQPVRVPDLEGLSVRQAEQRLVAARLRLGRVTRRDSTAPTGTIVRQRPGPGSLVVPGSAINVVVARQKRASVVPPLLELTLAQARQRLAQADLRPGRITEQLTEGGRDGIVLGQQPAAGASVAPRSIVNLTVMVAGRRVPNLVGDRHAHATRLLTSAGLVLGEVSFVFNTGRPPGQILNQSLPAGRVARAGTRVNIVVAEAAAIQPRRLLRTICVAPKIDGLTRDQARKLLAERTLDGRVRKRYGEQSNRVFRQEPRPGARFPCDQPITFDLGTIG